MKNALKQIGAMLASLFNQTVDDNNQTRIPQPGPTTAKSIAIAWSPDEDEFRIIPHINTGSKQPLAMHSGATKAASAKPTRSLFKLPNLKRAAIRAAIVIFATVAAAHTAAALTATVTAPNGGQTFTAGNTATITWTLSATTSVNYQKVAYSTDGGTTFTDIGPTAVFTPSDRSASWSIPSSLNSTQVRVRVRALDINANILAQDISDANFTVTPAVTLPTVTVNSPNGGENWTAGNTYNVTWAISGNTANINYQLVALSTDGGSTYNNISSALTPGSRSFSWTIPTGTSSSQVRLRVRALDINANILAQDASDSNSTISPPVVAPALTVSTPNGGESLTGGNTYAVTWDISGSTAQINYQLVAYSTDGGSTYVNISSALTPSSRSFSWTLPSGVNSSQVRVRVRALDINANILTQDASDNNFTISQPVVLPSLTVSTPNGGESLTGGNTFTVTWNISGDTSQINYQLVALSTDGGSTYVNISSALTPGSRSFSWTIPTGTSSSQVRIRVRALDINANILTQDASDNNFTISQPVIPPSLTVSAPNGGENLTGGNTFTVTWGISGDTSQINYQLVAFSTDGGSTYNNISSALTPGSRSFSWTLPNNVNSSQVRVRVRALDINANILTQDASDNNFSISQPVIPPSLTVSAPNGGENLTGGNTFTVTWGISGDTSQINYQLVAYSTDGGSTYVNISSALTPGARSFGWTLPNGVNSAQVRVRVRALDINANILTQDASDNNFTINPPIIAPALTVNAPNGGESLTGGSTFTVTWGVSGDTSQFNYQLVAYSNDGGSTYVNISSALTPGSRSFSWTLPTGVNSTQVRVRVRALDINANILTQDASDNNFTISQPVVSPSLTVNAPNGGENLTGGNIYAVTWGISGTTSQINYQLVAYSTDGGSTYVNISAALTPGSRSFSWTLPSNVNSSQVRVRVRALDVNANILTQDTSDGNFTVQPAATQPSSFAVQGQVFDANTRLPLNNVTVLLNGHTTTTANGNYSISQLQSGGTLSASASSYITGYLQVNPPTGATLISLAPIYLVAQTVVNPNKPVITQFTLKNPGVFFSGVACPNQIQFSVNWNGGTPGSVTVYQNNSLVQNIVGSGPTFACNIDMGSFPPSFNAGANQIRIQAVTATGTLSDVASYPVSVIPAPSALQTLLGYASLLGNTDAQFHWGFQFPEVPLSKTVNLPVLGNFGIQLGLKGSLDYTASSGAMKIMLGSGDSNDPSHLRNSSKLFFGDREIDWGISAEQDLLASPVQGLQFQDFTGAAALGGKIQIGQFGIADLLGPWAGSLISKIPLGDKLIDDVSISLFAKPECEGFFVGEWNSGLKFKQFQLSTTLGIEAVYEPELIEHVHFRALVGGQGTVVFGYPGDLFQSARIGAYASAELQVWLYQTSAEFTFCDYSYPQMSFTSLARTITPVSNTDFQPLPRKGMEQLPSAKHFARASLSGLGAGANAITGNQSAAALLENVFSDAQPALAAKGAELMLLWEADGGITNNLSFTDIHFSHYDGTNWTAPQAILQDARAEFAPAVASSASNEFVAVWSRVHDANFTNMDFNAMSADMEIASSYWNPATGWATPVELTTNTVLDCAPLLTAMPDGRAIVVWTRNSSNQFANSSSPSDVMFCLWNPTNHTWSEPQTLLSGIAFRQSQALATGSNRGIYAWAFNPTNAPGQIRFCEFTNGAWTAPTQFTTNVDGNQNIRAAISKSNDVYLVWQQGTNFVVSTNYNNPLSIPANIIGPDYQISMNDSGNMAAVFAQSSASGAAPFYTVFDAASGTWSHTKALRSDDGLSEHSVAPVFDESGTLAFAYLATQIDHTNKTVGSITISNAPVLGRTDLYVGRQTLFKDVALLPGNFILQGQTFLADDTLTLIATVTNSGNLAVSNLTLGFFDGDPASGGTRIATLTTTGAFEGGGQMQFSNSWVLPSSSVGHQIVALVDPDNAITDEFDRGNNSQALNLGVTNISLSLIYAKADTNGALHVLPQFQNTGGLPVGNVSATLRRLNSTNILGTVSAPALDPGRIAQLSIELPPGSQAAGQATYLLSLDNATANSNTDTNKNSVSFVVYVFIDSDGDGIPDDWELAHGLNPNDPSDALSDPDHDGMSNLAEFQAGTDPHDASSFLKVEPIQFVGGNPSGGVQISWGSVAGHLYTVMRSTNLVNGFVPIMPHISATPPKNSVIDTNTVGVGAAYYRIQVE